MRVEVAAVVDAEEVGFISKHLSSVNLVQEHSLQITIYIRNIHVNV